MKAPVAKEAPKVKIHGYEMTDNYAWLCDRSDKKDPEIIKYLDDNNRYTEPFMGQHKVFGVGPSEAKQTEWQRPMKKWSNRRNS